MAVSNMKVLLKSNIEKVWNTVTSLESYQWRSDLRRIEILSDKQFVEYTKDGYATKFTITRCEQNKCWEFDMENSNLKGRWIGVFTERNGMTEIDFTEDVVAKNIFMKPFVKLFLKKQQKTYAADLKKALQQDD